VNPAILNNPFTQVALPIMFTILIAAWLNGKGLDAINRRIDDLRNDMNTLRSDMNSRFGEVNRRLDSIERKLDDHGTRLTRVEEQVSPLRP
jgi:tetrahydromethanopterin S-methyltransferase subunit G